MGPSSKAGPAANGKRPRRSGTDQEIDLAAIAEFKHAGGFVDDGASFPPQLGTQLHNSISGQAHKAAWTGFFGALQKAADLNSLTSAARDALHNLRNDKPAAAVQSIEAATAALKWALDGPLALALSAVEAQVSDDPETVWTDLGLGEFADSLLRNLGAGASRSEQRQSAAVRGALVRGLQAISDAVDELPADSDVRALVPEDCFLSLGICQLLRCISPFLLDKSKGAKTLLREYNDADQQLFPASPLQDHFAVLDHVGKSLFLNLYIGQRVPVDLVLSREDIFEDFVAALQGDDSRPLREAGVITLRAYFKSEYGGKEINGTRVEEGEGLGPRKEFYALASLYLKAGWRDKVAVEGTVTIKKGAREVRGQDTKFLRDVQKGMRLSVGVGKHDKPHNEREKVEEVISDTQLVLAAPLPSAHNSESVWVSQDTTPLFLYSKGTETYWYNDRIQDTTENRTRYVAAGRMIAAALADRCKLDTILSEPIFSQLMLGSLNDYHPTVRDVTNFDADMGRNVCKIQKMSKGQVKELIESEELEDVVSTAEEYIAHTCRSLLLDSVGWQAAALHKGFQLGVVPSWWTKCRLTPRNLQKVVCGTADVTADFDFRKVFRVVEDPELQQCVPLRSALWATIDGLDRVKKRKLLQFITGVDRLPIAGTEMIKIEMPFMAYSEDEHKKTLMMMPQAHTCDNILELPNYWQSLVAVHKVENGSDAEPNENELVPRLRKLILQKVETAFSLADGFGLDTAFD